jgi:PII-like signaling protein
LEQLLSAFYHSHERQTDGGARSRGLWRQQCDSHASLIELSTDLSVVMEVVDDQRPIDRLLPILDEMILAARSSQWNA